MALGIVCLNLNLLCKAMAKVGESVGYRIIIFPTDDYFGWVINFGESLSQLNEYSITKSFDCDACTAFLNLLAGSGFGWHGG